MSAPEPPPVLPAPPAPPRPRPRARLALALLAAAFALTLGVLVKEVFLAPETEGTSLATAGLTRAPRQTRYVTGDADIDGLQRFLRPTLEANFKELPGRLGPVRGFGAGDAYPQLWVRDSATVLRLSRYLYPRDALVTWLEEHLAAQEANGSAYDWIAAGEPAPFLPWAPLARPLPAEGGALLSADKNTNESDQESSLVDAVHTAYQATAELAWLRRPLLGKSVLERAAAALESLGATKRDNATGLITSGLTADWGDVSPLYPDQRAIYLDERTPRVVGLYTNALYCHAAHELSELLEATGEVARAAAWEAESKRVREAINRDLWQEERGFYRMHRLVTPQLARGFPDDASIFALGGNAVALLAGVADPPRAARVLAAAERRRRDNGLATIAANLVPPYAAGTFAHASMREPWRYQNGGEWDWFAGRFVLAEFHLGQSERALEHLRALARRANAAGGLYEWYERDGTGQGSAHYAGSAAALADAILTGLFGVELSATGAAVDIRLGGHEGGVEVYQPASGRSMAYRQRLDATRESLVISYGGAVEGLGHLRVRLPPGVTARRVRRDGETAAFGIEVVGEDTFVAVETDWHTHRLEIDLERGGAEPQRR